MYPLGLLYFTQDGKYKKVAQEILQHNLVLLVIYYGKRPFGRPRRRWEDNIKIDLLEVGGGCEDWMELARDRDRWRALVSTVMNLRVP